MSTTKRNNEIPQLVYNNELGRWLLYLTRTDAYNVNGFDDATFALCITVGWTGDSWFQYCFLAWLDGQMFEVVTQDEFKQRVQDIADYECDEAAAIWRRDQEQCMVVSDNHPVFALKRRWEAMMELDLFFPAVTIREWVGIPINKDLAERMRAATDKAFAEEFADDEEPRGTTPGCHNFQGNC